MITSAHPEPVHTAAMPAREPVRARILLVGNYPADGQESMQRFAQVMLNRLQRVGRDVELIAPPVVFGKWVTTTTCGVGKWLGYIDKYLIFPSRLRRFMRSLSQTGDRPVVTHICDHSNAIYSGSLRGRPVVVTCHDLLAVRGALGEQTDCPASMLGRLLQRWIVRGLSRASAIVAVSHATMRDVERIIRPIEGQRRWMVSMGLNHDYRCMERLEAQGRLTASGLSNDPYVLNVGSNLRRKNRDGVLRIFARAAGRWSGKLVLAGEPPNEDLLTLARALDIIDRIVVVEKPQAPLLEALYNSATALVFPSRFEGFGWPIIEAQACGCPVICSNAAPLPEVVGDGGIVCPLDDEEAFASAILRLLEPQEREHWVRKGLSNAAEFSTDRMIEGYLDIYDQMEVRE